MKLNNGLKIGILALAVAVSTAGACRFSGGVYCDVNENGILDEGDTPLGGVTVVLNGSHPSLHEGTTGPDGTFEIFPWSGYTYVASLDASTLPADATIVVPASGTYSAYLGEGGVFDGAIWLIQSASCRQEGACWLTGGGVKFERLVGKRMATASNGGGPADTIGGNVFPSCSPNPGEGGQWNHVAHSLGLHFQGRSVFAVECGNVEEIPPGSTSPKTDYNFIEFEGIGRLKGLGKNSDVDVPLVYFFGRCEDRNEPGTKETTALDGGKYIDRYFLHVFADPADPIGTTLMLFDVDGDPTTVDPKTITGGNLQLHMSSCDNPPPL